jgi:hypothetical protein
MRHATRLALAALALLIAGPALAFRCNGRIVSDGDPQDKVRHICGEPTSARQFAVWRAGIPRGRVIRETTLRSGDATIEATEEELALHDRSVVEVLIEEWTYNFGPRKLMRVVRFENGLVTGVSHLGYGYHE